VPGIADEAGAVNAEEARRVLAARIRAERKSRLWDVPEMARQLSRAAGDARGALPDHGVLASYVRRWESTRAGISERFRLLYAAAFGIAEDELFSVPPHHHQGSRNAGLPSGGWAEAGDADLARVPPCPDASTASAAAHDEDRLVFAARTPRRHDPGVVDALSAVLAGQRHAEDILGSASLIEPVRAQLVVVKDLVTEARGELRTRVLDIGSQWAQFAGWLYASTGDFSEACRFYGVALEWAMEADRPDMVATALNMCGHAAWLRGSIGPMIGLSGAAQRDKRISPGIRALAVQQEARGIALTGESRIDDINRRFDETQMLVSAAAERPEKEPPWIYFFSPHYLTTQRGLAYRMLGYYAEASDLLVEGLAAIPAEMRKSAWVARYVLSLAVTRAKTGDVAQACASAREANIIAQQTGSVRLRGDLARFHARIAAEWPGNATVIELGESLG
jgi:hypothetical protein